MTLEGDVESFNLDNYMGDAGFGLVLCNISKRHNFGGLIRSAAAFAASIVIIVGAKKLKTFGNQGTMRTLPFIHFETLSEYSSWATANGILTVGAEINDRSINVFDLKHHIKPSKRYGVMLGNEGTGMSPTQLAVCDLLVHIPQYRGSTASLNVTVAGSILMHHMANVMEFTEHKHSEGKYEAETTKYSKGILNAKPRLKEKDLDSDEIASSLTLI